MARKTTVVAVGVMPHKFKKLPFYGAYRDFQSLAKGKAVRHGNFLVFIFMRVPA